MDSTIERVETDSTVNFELVTTETDHLVEPSDSEVEFRTHARQQEAGQLLAGIADAVAEGPQTDADAYQVADPNVGHRVGGLAPRDQLPATRLPQPLKPELTAACTYTQRRIRSMSRAQGRFRRCPEPW